MKRILLQHGMAQDEREIEDARSWSKFRTRRRKGAVEKAAALRKLIIAGKARVGSNFN
jgi:hypothetical protein